MTAQPFILRPGVHCVMATPFLPDESLDVTSLTTLLDYLIDQRCEGALLLGVLGEADRLTDNERKRVIERCIEYAGNKLQISVGVTANSTFVTRARAAAAQSAGAAAVMVSPPPGSSAGGALAEHFRRIAADLTIPVIVQDHPTSSGVKMPAEFIASLEKSLPPGSMVKVEEPPTPPKMAAILAATDALGVMGGLGGVSLYHELDAGAIGTMTGFALPSMLAAIIKAYRAGDKESARRRFEEALPLLVFEAQPGMGVALRKQLLKERGALAHATIRQPAPLPDPLLLRQLRDLLTSVRLEVYA